MSQGGLTAANVGRQKAVGAQPHGGDGVDDREHVVVLEGAQPRHVVALVQLPPGLEVVPQRLVRKLRPQLHADLQRSTAP
jgi:hypothetical protein